jgi:hypothetical protein
MIGTHARRGAVFASRENSHAILRCLYCACITMLLCCFFSVTQRAIGRPSTYAPEHLQGLDGAKKQGHLIENLRCTIGSNSPINTRFDGLPPSSASSPCPSGARAGLTRYVVSTRKVGQQSSQTVSASHPYLDTPRRWLPRCKIYGIAVHHALRHVAKIRDQTVNHIQRQRLANDDAKNLRLLFVRRQRIAYIVS